MEFVPKLLLYISRFSVLLPIFFLFKVKKSIANNITGALFALLFTAAFFDLLGYILIMKLGKSNVEAVNIYFILQFFILSYLYHILLENRIIIYASIAVFTGFTIYNSLYGQPFSQFQSWSDALQSIIFLVYAILCYLQQIKNLAHEDKRLSDLILWVNMGVMLYFGMNLYLFISSTYIFTYQSTDTAMIFWSFHNFFNIAKNVLFAVGIYRTGNKVVKQTLQATRSYTKLT